MKANGRSRKFKVEWTTSDNKLTPADIDRIEDLLAPLIARLIMDERSAAAHEVGSGENKDEG